MAAHVTVRARSVESFQTPGAANRVMGGSSISRTPLSEAILGGLAKNGDT